MRTLSEVMASLPPERYAKVEALSRKIMMEAVLQQLTEIANELLEMDQQETTALANDIAVCVAELRQLLSVDAPNG